MNESAFATLVPTSRQRLARGIAMSTVLLFFVPMRLVPIWYFGILDTLTLCGLVAVLCMNEGDASGLGFRATPLRGWSYWVKFSILAGLIVGAIALVYFGGVLWLGWPLHVRRVDPQDFGSAFVNMCLNAPLYEEIVFRSLLVMAVYPTLGDRGTIVFSGVVFALMHVMCGATSPENQIAGFFLTWAYLRSGSILVPMAMHSAGNAVAMMFQLGYCYWCPLLPTKVILNSSQT
jgi:uncharacterized protein